MATLRSVSLGLVLSLGALVTAARAAEQSMLELKPGDHVAIIGNTLADRMQHFGYLETLLHHRFPQHQLVVRNLGFSGDELTLRLRSAGFGSPDDHLKAVQADVVLAFFGYDESFGGEGGAREVQARPGGLHQAHARRSITTAKPRRGWCSFRRSRTRIYMIATCPTAPTTIAASSSTRPPWPRLLTSTMCRWSICSTPSRQLYAAAKKPLTINGIHLNECG